MSTATRCNYCGHRASDHADYIGSCMAWIEGFVCYCEYFQRPTMPKELLKWAEETDAKLAEIDNLTEPSEGI